MENIFVMYDNNLPVLRALNASPCRCMLRAY